MQGDLVAGTGRVSAHAPPAPPASTRAPPVPLVASTRVPASARSATLPPVSGRAPAPASGEPPPPIPGVPACPPTDEPLVPAMLLLPPAPISARTPPVPPLTVPALPVPPLPSRSAPIWPVQPADSATIRAAHSSADVFITSFIGRRMQSLNNRTLDSPTSGRASSAFFVTRTVGERQSVRRASPRSEPPLICRDASRGAFS